MRFLTPAVAGILVALLACSACAGGHTARTSSPPRSAGAEVPRFPSQTITPTYKGEGVSTCGEWIIRAVTPRGTFPLLSCAAMAGVASAIVHVKVGDEVFISGSSAETTLVPRPTNLVAQVGPLFLAKAAGTTSIDITGWSCISIVRSLNKSCPLLTIVATQ
jgi:hypothetical protein